MEQNEITNEGEVELQDTQTEEESVEATEEESVSDDQGSEDESIEAKLAKVQAEAAKYRRLFERSQKKPQPQATVSAEQKPKPVPSPLNVDERILKSQGMSDSLLKELKAVAQIRGVGLIEAQADPVFLAIKAGVEKDEKREKASLPASRGSGQVKPKKDFTTPGLSAEEHYQLWLERQNH